MNFSLALEFQSPVSFYATKTFSGFKSESRVHEDCSISMILPGVINMEFLHSSGV